MRSTASPLAYLEALDRHFEEGAVGTPQRRTSRIDHHTNVEGVGTDSLRRPAQRALVRVGDTAACA
jgi:hypothetical protein